MNDQSRDELRRELREVFGCDFSEQELEIYGDRLRRQLLQIRRLEAWEEQLGLVEPATVSVLLSGVGGGHGTR